MKTNISENITALAQGEVLLQQLDDEVYTRPQVSVFRSTIGTHIRHNLDHYSCFLAGLDNGCIDYAARQRDTRLELDRRYAIAEMSTLRERLQGIPENLTDTNMSIKRDVGTGRAITSIKRELEFLLSHTIHHYAIVAIICRLQGVCPDADFGVAPSTLRYRSVGTA